MDSPLLLLRDVISDIRENHRNFEWWKDRVRERINTPVQHWLRPRSNAVEILEEEWSTLVVLDACRADLFSDVFDQSRFANYRTVTSPGSETKEWLHYVFDDQHGGIVYVAGNPMVSNVKPDSFYSIIEVWQDGWDPSRGIITPDSVTEAAIKAREEYPDKRLIVHYMQPHAPFIGYPELNFSGDADDFGLEVDESHPNYDRFEDINNPWEALEAGVVEADTVKDAYKDTLQAVVNDVERLVDSTTDRVVITSDHGNAIGERSWPIPIRLYGHPGKKRHSVLTTVPWAVIEGEQRDIRREGVGSSTTATDEELEDHLAHLGYVEE